MFDMSMCVRGMPCTINIRLVAILSIYQGAEPTWHGPFAWDEGDVQIAPGGYQIPRWVMQPKKQQLDGHVKQAMLRRVLRVSPDKRTSDELKILQTWMNEVLPQRAKDNLLTDHTWRHPWDSLRR